MKVVINTCYGGFGLSEVAKQRYQELSGKKPAWWTELKRNDKYLVQVVEELGKAADCSCSELAIVDIEPGRWYKIEEYDGNEEIHYRDIDDEWQLATDD